MKSGAIIDGEKLRQNVMDLGAIGLTSAGVTRLAFTQEDAEARDFIIRLMREEGLAVRVDAVGNVFGRRAGRNAAAPVLMIGSHIDSVINGGMFDGCLGVLSGVAVVRALNAANVLTEMPLEIVAWANEEGPWGSGTFGSRAFVGTLPESELAMVTEGLTIADRMKSIGLRPDAFRECIKPYPVWRYLELHIEQGNVLWSENVDIGVVTGIVNTSRWLVTVRGAANHAGTTPMRMRDDALVKAAKFIVAANEEALRSDDMVSVVGQIAIEPGSPNVIPGKVQLVLGMRSMSQERLDLALSRLTKIAEGLGGFDIKLVMTKPPVLMDESLMETIAQSCSELGLTTKRMSSGAGHDAMIMAHVAPVGMLFVPSKDGLSHVGNEFTEGRHATQGAQVLLNTVLSLGAPLTSVG